MAETPTATASKKSIAIHLHLYCNTQKNPRTHKNKTGTSTPPLLKKPRTSPLKGGILWARGFSSRKNQKMPGAHNWRSRFRPQNCRRKFYGHHAFVLQCTSNLYCAFGAPFGLRKGRYCQYCYTCLAIGGGISVGSLRHLQFVLRFRCPLRFEEREILSVLLPSVSHYTSLVLQCASHSYCRMD